MKIQTYEEEKKQFVNAVMEIKRQDALKDINITKERLDKISVSQEELYEIMVSLKKIGAVNLEAFLTKGIEAFFDLAKSVDIEAETKIVAVGAVGGQANTLIHNLKYALKEPKMFDYVSVDILRSFESNFFSSKNTLKYYSEVYSSVNEYLKNPTFDIKEPDLFKIKEASHKEYQEFISIKERDEKIFIDSLNKENENISNEDRRELLHYLINCYHKGIGKYQEKIFIDNAILSRVKRDNWLNQFNSDNDFQKEILGSELSENLLEFIKIIAQYQYSRVDMDDLIQSNLLNVFIEEKNLSGILNVLTVYFKTKEKDRDFYLEKQNIALPTILELEQQNSKDNKESLLWKLEVSGETGKSVCKEIEKAYKIHKANKDSQEILKKWQNGEDVLSDTPEIKTRVFDINIKNLIILTNSEKFFNVPQILAKLAPLRLDNVVFNNIIKNNQMNKSTSYLVIAVSSEYVDTIQKKEVEEIMVSLFSHEKFQKNADYSERDFVELINNEFRELLLHQKFKSNNDSLEEISSKVTKRPKV